MQEWNAGIQKEYRLSPSTFSGKVKKSAKAENHKETQDSRNPLQGRNDGRLMPWGSTDPVAESNFIWSFAQCHVISLLK
jgi:hypothetical protein